MQRRMIVANYTPSHEFNNDDLVLLMLDRPFTLGENTNIFPACLINGNIKTYNSLLFAGYGIL